MTGPRLSISDLAERFALGGAQAAALEAYVDLLAGWKRANVTGLSSREQIVETLLGDALALLDVAQLRERAGAGWLDLGAGAGIPGIPLALALPAVELTLLEAVARKCEFLEAAVGAAGLASRARVVCARSEAYAAASPGREGALVVFARAVAPLPVLVELAAPLLAPGGVLLASKTAAAVRDEGAAAGIAAGLCGLAAGPVVRLERSPLDQAVCAVYEKVAPTPDRFPRREGIAAKRPLAS
ncbi:MAG: RsmG family class I SAM-dependent methyltransferase [Actinomycetes bacterium]